ncbi:hypothetical protein BGW37DRAFT_471880 [Umbelopsis sp. PMI_123]|nr:hypothetical protein BGW37DRAFT_471880 [Umbelopsis sp. PMI_123]
MSSYFDDLNITTSAPSRRQNRDVDISSFMDMHAPRQSFNDFGNQDYLEHVMRVANMFTGIRQNVEQDDANQQQFLDDLISQLLDEAQTNAKGPPPASDRFIKSLPRVKLDSLSSDEACIICKENFHESQSVVTKMPCHHYFDQECLLPWLQLHNTCPMCRYTVETEEQVKQEEQEATRDWMYG